MRLLVSLSVPQGEAGAGVCGGGGSRRVGGPEPRAALRPGGVGSQPKGVLPGSHRDISALENPSQMGYGKRTLGWQEEPESCV